MARRQHLFVTVLLVAVVFFTVSFLFTSPTRSIKAGGHGAYQPDLDFDKPAVPLKKAPDGSGKAFSVDLDHLPADMLEGDSIAPKLENATLKAELGRATWKFLHTMVARFPEEPTPSERQTLETFIHLFSRLYPCGDCARHFRQLLAEYPPQTSSRQAAAGWLCFAHNVVNERLEKEIFDCNNIGDFYDCGCGEEGKEGEEKKDGELPDLELVKD